MMSAFLVRDVVLIAIAWAMAWSSSRSLDSSTDRSSCCSAVIGLLISWYRNLGGILSRRGEQGGGVNPAERAGTPKHHWQRTAPRPRVGSGGALRRARVECRDVSGPARQRQHIGS